MKATSKVAKVIIKDNASATVIRLTPLTKLTSVLKDDKIHREKQKIGCYNILWR